MINIRINDVPLQVEEGTTILKAARKLNICSPKPMRWRTA